MKKKLILILVAALVVTLGVYVGYRFAKRGTDIIGVTTLSDKNTVIMNAKTGSEFAAGTGYLTVAEGERIHMEYDLSAGSIDVAIKSGEGAMEAIENMDFENLPSAEDMTGDGAFGETGVSGKGSMDFDAAAGEYTVYIVNNGAVGSATLTAKK